MAPLVLSISLGLGSVLGIVWLLEYLRLLFVAGDVDAANNLMMVGLVSISLACITVAAIMLVLLTGLLGLLLYAVVAGVVVFVS